LKCPIGTPLKLQLNAVQAINLCQSKD